MIAKPQHRFMEVNGIRMHVVEQGEGPLVLLCHGFPESWYSWRHQLSALAAAGFRAVAPDMRGYGETEQPAAIDRYTMLDLVGDMVGLLDTLGVATAVIAGHDWGAPVAWHAALLRPDRFSGVIGLSVPFIPRGQVYPSKTWPETADAIFYQRYFQTEHVAEAEFARDIRFSIRSTLCSFSGQAMPVAAEGGFSASVGMIPRSGGMLSGRTDPSSLPPWLTEADVDAYVASFVRSGFRGGLNWYRNIDRNWELFAPFAGSTLPVPALYIVGDRDLVLAFQGMSEQIANLSKYAPRLRKTIILPGCGHWTQQEQPHEVNAAMIHFLKELR